MFNNLKRILREEGLSNGRVATDGKQSVLDWLASHALFVLGLSGLRQIRAGGYESVARHPNVSRAERPSDNSGHQPKEHPIFSTERKDLSR